MRTEAAVGQVDTLGGLVMMSLRTWAFGTFVLILIKNGCSLKNRRGLVPFSGNLEGVVGRA